MYCGNCEKIILEDSNFCVFCGTSTEIKNTGGDIYLNEKFEFKRLKEIGRLPISCINTKVDINKTMLNIKHEKFNFFWFNRKPIHTSHNILTFTDIKIRKSIQKNNLIICAIFCIVGLIQSTSYNFANILLSIGIISGVVCWIGLGYSIKITKSNGAEITIPAEFSRNAFNDCTDLVSNVLRINKSIVVHQ